MLLVRLRPEWTRHSSSCTRGTSSRWSTFAWGPCWESRPHPLTTEVRTVPMLRTNVPCAGGMQMGTTYGLSDMFLRRCRRAMSASLVVWLYRGWITIFDTFLICSVPSSMERMCSPERKRNPKMPKWCKRKGDSDSECLWYSEFSLRKRDYVYGRLFIFLNWKFLPTTTVSWDECNCQTQWAAVRIHSEFRITPPHLYTLSSFSNALYKIQ